MPLRRAALVSRLLASAGVWHVLLVGLTLALTWIFLVTDLREEYHDAIDGAQRETSALARGLGETTLASFDTIDQTLKDLRDDYSRDPRAFRHPHLVRGSPVRYRADHPGVDHRPRRHRGAKQPAARRPNRSVRPGACALPEKLHRRRDVHQHADPRPGLEPQVA